MEQAEGNQILPKDYKDKKGRMVESLNTVYNTTDCLRYSMFMLQNLLNNTKDFNIIQAMNHIPLAEQFKKKYT